jgi:uncharacterized protein YqeY
MLQNKIKNDQLNARKNRDRLRANILTTLYSEVSIIGKNEGNRSTTDKEALKKINYFLKNAKENLEKIKDGRVISYPERTSEIRLEIEIYESYLPTQLSDDEILKELDTCIGLGIDNIGAIMKHFKTNFAGLYDGKKLSSMVKEKI